MRIQVDFRDFTPASVAEAETAIASGRGVTGALRSYSEAGVLVVELILILKSE